MFVFVSRDSVCFQEFHEGFWYSGIVEFWFSANSFYNVFLVLILLRETRSLGNLLNVFFS